MFQGPEQGASCDQLYVMLKQMGVAATPAQVHKLFLQLDQDKDGMVSRKDWATALAVKGNLHVEQIKRLLRERRLTAEATFALMGLDSNKKTVSLLELINGLQRLDETLPKDKAFLVAKHLIAEDEFIELVHLREKLDFLDFDSAQVVG